MRDSTDYTPLISVIIPVYNVAPYVERCLSSVRNQTYKKLEIICIDDGSTDNSGEICDAIARGDFRVTVIHQTNAGLSCARNKGLSEFTGEYVCFIDSDDYIHPSYVETMYKACIANDSKMAMCGHLSTNEFKHDNMYRHLEYSDIRHDFKLYNSRDILLDYYGPMHGTYAVAWNKLIHRDVVGDIIFEPGIIHEDEATIFKFIYRAEKVVYVPEQLYYYFNRGDSITGGGFNSKNLDILIGYERRMAFYQENGEKDLFLKEQQYFLSAILIIYYKVLKEISNRKDLLKLLRNKYRDAYKNTDKQNIVLPKRLIYFICIAFPGFYGKLRTRSREKRRNNI